MRNRLDDATHDLNQTINSIRSLLEEPNQEEYDRGYEAGRNAVKTIELDLDSANKNIELEWKKACLREMENRIMDTLIIFKDFYSNLKDEKFTFKERLQYANELKKSISKISLSEYNWFNDIMFGDEILKSKPKTKKRSKKSAK